MSFLKKFVDFSRRGFGERLQRNILKTFTATYNCTKKILRVVCMLKIFGSAFCVSMTLPEEITVVL